MTYLFIAHITSNKDASSVILYFIRWLKRNRVNPQITVVSLKREALYKKFRLVANVFFRLKVVNVAMKSWYKQILSIIDQPSKNIDDTMLKKRMFAEHYDLLSANTVFTIPTTNQLEDSYISCRLLAHINHDRALIKRNLSNFNEYMSYLDLFVAPSFMVKNTLMDYGRIPENFIYIIHEFAQIRKAAYKNEDTRHILNGGSGTVHWRKGTKLFIRVAKFINHNIPDYDIPFDYKNLKRLISSTSKIKNQIILIKYN